MAPAKASVEVQREDTVDRVGQFAFAGPVKKQLADNGCVGFQASEYHAVMPVQPIDVHHPLADDICGTQIVNPRLGFVVEQDAAVGVGDDDTFIKGIEHRKKIEFVDVRHNRSIRRLVRHGQSPWLVV